MLTCMYLVPSINQRIVFTFPINKMLPQFRLQKVPCIYYIDTMRVAKSLPISGDWKLQSSLSLLLLVETRLSVLFGRFGRDSPSPLSAAAFVKYNIIAKNIICRLIFTYQYFGLNHLYSCSTVSQAHTVLPYTPLMVALWTMQLAFGNLPIYTCRVRKKINSVHT